MGFAITINPLTGSLGLGNFLLQPHQSKLEIETQIASFLKGSRDHGNGFEWLYLKGLTFGSQTALLSLCFHLGQLEQAAWSVQLPDAPMDGGWPTRDAIDEEIVFVRRTLSHGGFQLNDGLQKFEWGEIWSGFDAKGYLASNGLRYRP